MLFNSVEFFFFFIIVYSLYWFVFNKKLRNQNTLLLIASYFFYGWWDWRFLFIMTISSATDFFAGMLIYRSNNEFYKKVFVAISLCVNLGILFFFKYYNFFIDSWITLWDQFGISVNVPLIKVILPVGISFYTFQSISYTLDVFRKKLEPTKDPIDYFAFVSFFPQLVAGPIERATNLLPQILKPRTFNYNQSVDGVRLAFLGFFKKIVIADSLAPMVNDVYSHYQDFSGSTLFLTAIYFAIQIYCDFSGYSDIAIGIAKLFGFDFIKNFDHPFISKNITEFWRRWHISLSSWFNEYLFTPLYINFRNLETAGLCLALFITFLLSGLWHGAGWTFIIYGSMHGLALVYEVLTKKWRKKIAKKTPVLLYNYASMTLTFLFVITSWVFFRAETLSKSIGYLKAGTKNLMSIPDNTNGLVYVSIILLIDWRNRTSDSTFQLMKPTTITRPVIIMIDLLMGIMIVSHFITNEQQQFIYFAF